MSNPGVEMKAGNWGGSFSGLLDRATQRSQVFLDHRASRSPDFLRVGLQTMAGMISAEPKIVTHRRGRGSRTSHRRRGPCGCLPHLSCFIERDIRFLSRSTDSTSTSTFWPTLTTSRGFLMKRSAIWEM